MLDISFSEIAVIGAVALVVLGPERLPKVARTAGHLFGRLQRYVNGVKADIAREMEASELSKIKQDVQDAARSFEKSVQEHASDVKAGIEATAGVEAEAKSMHALTEHIPSATDAALAEPKPALSNAALTLPNAAPVLGFGGFIHMEGVANSDEKFGQGLFDFGVESERPKMKSGYLVSQIVPPQTASQTTADHSRATHLPVI